MGGSIVPVDGSGNENHGLSLLNDLRKCYLSHRGFEERGVFDGDGGADAGPESERHVQCGNSNDLTVVVHSKEPRRGKDSQRVISSNTSKAALQSDTASAIKSIVQSHLPVPAPILRSLGLEFRRSSTTL
jgi:hypothetical protein